MKTKIRHITHRLLVYLCLVTLPSTLYASSDSEGAMFRQVKIVAERLASLHVPRSGHSTLYANGELTVFGGHTSGFLPTPTAEYYKDGEWHLMQMVYAHDGGTVIPLKSGKVLIAGGFEKHLGIGQTFVVEKYDPADHSFTGFGCLNKKRVSASGIELDSSQVYIAGNWYHDDAIERFDGVEKFSFFKNVTEERTLPHLLRIAPNDILILGGSGIHGEPLHSGIVDRLHGDTLHVPLLETWRPLQFDFGHHCDNSFIGNAEKGIFAYLIPVQNGDGQVAIAHVEGTSFSLLPTACPIPTKSQWGDIRYYTPVVVDRQSKRGYMMGIDKDCRQYILAIDYNKRIDKGVPLTLYYTDPLPDVCSLPVVTPEGHLMMVGGVNFQTNNNYSPSSSTYLFPVGATDTTHQQTPWLPWMATGILVLLLLAYLIYHYVRSRRLSPPDLVINEGKAEAAPCLQRTADAAPLSADGRAEALPQQRVESLRRRNPFRHQHPLYIREHQGDTRYHLCTVHQHLPHFLCPAAVTPAAHHEDDRGLHQFGLCQRHFLLPHLQGPHGHDPQGVADENRLTIFALLVDFRFL